MSSSCHPPPPVRHFPLLPVVFPSSTTTCFSSCPSLSSSCPPPSPVAGFPTPLLVIVIVSVPTQQCHWGVGVLSCDFPIIIIVAVVVSPLLLLLFLLLVVVVSPPFLLVVSPPFLLAVSLLWVISLLVSLSFPLLLVSPSPSSSFALPAPHRFPPSCHFPHLHLLVVLVVFPACCPIMDNEHEPRQTSWLVFRNSTRASHLMGPPLVPPSLDPPSSEAKPPTSLWKGEGRLGAASSLVRELGRC